MSTPIDFFLNAEFLSTAIDLTAGTVTSGITEDDSDLYDCKAECSITVAVAQSLFQFQTDSLDMTNTASEDVLYKLEYTSSDPLSPLSPDFVSNAIMTANGINIDHETKNIPHDFVGYIALNLFGTPKGVDLFVNEEEVVASVQEQSVIAFDERLNELVGYGELTYENLQSDGTTTVTNGNPSKMVYDHILASDPARFADISGYKIGETDWFKMPILEGDSINFVLSVTSPNDKSIVGSTDVIDNRRYQIKMIVIA